MVDEKRLASIMKTLELTREEALELMEEDTKIDRMDVSKVNDDLTPEQKQTVKKMKQADRKPTVYNWKKKVERKPNELKREIIDDFYDFLCENWPETAKNANILNVEREIGFEINGISFSLTLTQHRPKKN